MRKRISAYPKATNVLRTLFSKILVWSVLAKFIIVGSLIALTTLYVPQSQDAVNNAWSLYAHDAVMLYEKMGPEALQDFLTRTGEDTLLRLNLALARPGTTSCAPADAGDVIGESKGAAGGDAATTIKTSGADGNYCLTVHVKPGGLPESPENFHMRMNLAILIEMLGSIALSYFIARYLSRPISELRRASALLAQGDFSARVGQKFSSRKDEAADLVREFDQMATRLSGLIESQHRLIADISHEIKSPLARLSIALGLARRSAEQYAPRQFDRMESEVEKISLLASELLVLEGLDAVVNLTIEPVPLCATIEEILSDAIYESDIRADDFVLLRPDKELVIYGDGRLLRRAVENLVRNAIFYTQPGTKIEIALSEIDADRISIEIRDHGPGVPDASLPHIFEPFYRVDEARSRTTGGSGIGLAICQRIILLHRGMLSAGNNQPHGLIVTIELPSGPAKVTSRSHGRVAAA